ncbi:MAG: hypothetical protein HUJ22_08965 [Gracilimonas sp.]|uniref:sensor histidine kinase n=1 Tax=Gracilimonas sp. TaxID=1974203 RepID=UPI00198AA945|nr:sensor histidine kinase [Gracilimonas sp.]MBD3616692.1 hypothetical protein [Gracilimonas sp.]
MAFGINRITRYLTLGVVVISALVMGFILYELGGTKQYFANQLIEQSSKRVESELDQFFLPVKNIINTLKQQQEMQLLQNPTSASLNRYFIPVINQHPQISSIGIADSRGKELNILPDSIAGSWLNREVYVDEWGMTERWRRLAFDEALIPVESWTQDLKTDPRNREWFTGALRENGEFIHWTDPYTYMTGELGLTASVTWKSSQNDTLQHILALDLTLEDISKFSQNLSLTENNQLFIITKQSKKIIGLPGNYKNVSSKELAGKILSTPKEFGSPALVELLNYPNDEIVSFKAQNQKWWGIVKTYSITPNKEFLIAVLIPESDFLQEIDRTNNAVIAGFFVILFLSSLLVFSNNKLRNLSQELNEKNNLITGQKERLFAEVHHRVKNNLAVMGALIELENMESNDPSVKQVLTQTQRRIKSMATVQEVLYKSDDMRRVWIHDFIPGILNLSKKDFSELDIEINQEINPILINVNQALTYGLLLNECMNSIFKFGFKLRREIQVRVYENENSITTEIKVNSEVDNLQKNQGVGRQLIEVLLAQLKANLKVASEDGHTLYLIIFEPKDKKGIMSNLSY